MKQLLILIVFFVFAIKTAFSQDCQKILIDGDKALVKGDYKTALLKYVAVRNVCGLAFSSKAELKIFSLFERMKKVNDSLSKTLLQLKATKKEFKNLDSSAACQIFRNKNKAWLKDLSADEEIMVFDLVTDLQNKKEFGKLDSFSALCNLVFNARSLKTYVYEKVSDLVEMDVIPTIKDLNSSNSLNIFGMKFMDVFIKSALTEMHDAEKLFNQEFDDRIRRVYYKIADSVDKTKKRLERNFTMPDTIINIPDKTLFSMRSVNRKHYLLQYKDGDSYYNTLIHYRDISLPNFQIVKDTIFECFDTGTYFSLVRATPEFKYSIAKEVSYSLKPNKVEFDKVEYKYQTNGDLFGWPHQLQKRFSDFDGYVFTSDSKTLILTKSKTNGGGVYKYDLEKNELKNFKKIKNVDKIVVDYQSPRFVNYVDGKFDLYNLDGKRIFTATSKDASVSFVKEIEFTGTHFLVLTDDDSVCLFDYLNKAVIKKFPVALINQIVVSPNDKDILLSYNTKYKLDGDSYESFYSVLTEMNFQKKKSLYSDCSMYMFSENGDYLIATGEGKILRWELKKIKSDIQNNYRSILSAQKISATKSRTLELGDFENTNDPIVIEKGARYFKNLVETMDDYPVLRKIYYNYSAHLFDKLIDENKEIKVNEKRIPLFYDWRNWIDNQCGQNNFEIQLKRQRKANVLWNNFVNSRDSIYPELLFYAANGYKFERYILDSIALNDSSVFDEEYLILVKKELDIRDRAFVKDTEREENSISIITALKRLSYVYDIIGQRLFKLKQMDQRLKLYSSAQNYFISRTGEFPPYTNDSLLFNVQTKLASTYFLLHCKDIDRNSPFNDSMNMFLGNATTLMDKRDFDGHLLKIIGGARLLLVGEFDKGMAKFDEIKSNSCESFDGVAESEKKHIIWYLEQLESFGCRSENVTRAIVELKKTKDKK